MLPLCPRPDGCIEGFMKVFSKIMQFKAEGSLEGWIKRIMVNESLGYLRQQKRLPESSYIDNAYDIADMSHADQALEAEELLGILDHLPTGYRTVFNLFAIEGYTHCEIGELLGISENTSKSQLHRARAHLQHLLKEKEDSKKKAEISV
jgi:RNA polymerase sigma factor (sigma-70 family)